MRISQFFIALFLLLLRPFSYAMEPVSDRYVSFALQGDLAPASELFALVNSRPANLPAMELAKRFNNRFVTQEEDLSPATGDAFADAVVVAYRRYWGEGLMGRMTRHEADLFLEHTLSSIISEFRPAETLRSPGDVYMVMGDMLRENGFNYLDTPAPPFRDLFLWKGGEQKKFSVRLTDRTQKVNVNFMTELYSLGWKHFATLGLVSTTGWVDGDQLYCIGWAYDRESENFEVSYLKHEARHLTDFQLFPGLSSADLEYRAKLTEISFASASQMRLLDDFTRKSSPSPDSPHSYANYRVTRDLYHELHGEGFPETDTPWLASAGSATNRAARELLRRNTDQLLAGIKDGQ